MSPEIGQDPAAQLLHRGLRARRTPQLRGRGGAHAAPHQTKGTALLLRDSASQRMPKEEHQQGRAPAGPSHAESTPGREEAGAHPILPAKPPGGHACLSCLPPGCLPPCGPRVPTLRTTAAWVPVIGPGGAARRGARGPSSNRPLLPGPAPGRARAQLSCLSLEPRGTSQVTLGLWAPGSSVGPVSSNGCQPQPGHKYIKYETKTKYVFSIKAQLSCLPDQVLMNARPRTEGRAGRRVGGRGLRCPPKRGKGGDRTTREPVLV